MTTKHFKKTLALASFALLFSIIINNTAFALQASWYSVSSLKKEGTWAHSKGIMANGHTFSDSGLTCATRLYPLGTTLLITNKNNGKSVIVTITDRIGKRFAKTRVDLSRHAFELISSLDKGLIPIEVKPIKIIVR